MAREANLEEAVVVDRTARLVWAVWCAGYVIAAAVGLWLWREHAVASMELLFVDARARMAATAPLASELLIGLPPLVFLPSLVSGSAVFGMAFLTASALAALCAVLRSADRSAWWLVPLALHPVVLIGGVEYPTVIAELCAIVIAVAGMAFYIVHKRLDWLTCGGLALGALVLVDWHAWPFALVVAGLMAAWHRGEWMERATLVLIVTFPTIGLMVAWMAFNAMITGSPFAFLASPVLGLARSEAWGLAHVEESTLGALRTALTVAPLAVMVPAWARNAARGDARTGWCLTLLAWSPLTLVLLPRGIGAAEPFLVASVYGVAVAVMALVVMPRGHVMSHLIAAMLAVTGAAVGHASLFTDQRTEPARLVGRLTGVEEPGHLGELRACAKLLNARMRAGDRLLFDDVRFFALVGLLDRRDSWLPSSTAEFDLARQQPARWARFVLDVQPDSPLARRAVRFDRDELTREYQLVRVEGALRLFELRPSAGTPTMRITLGTNTRRVAATRGPAERVQGARNTWGS